MIPFSSIIGHEDSKLALMLLAVNPRIGGLLLSGIKGSGKSTLVRSFPSILPKIDVIDDCEYNCIYEDN